MVFKLITLLVMALLVSSCTSGSEPAPATSAPVAPAKSKAEWETKWDEVTVQGRSEKNVTVYGRWTPEVRTPMTEIMERKYGIQLDWLMFDGTASLVAKAQAEQGSGVFNADLFTAGNLYAFKGVLPFRPIRPLLILPEVVDPKAWRGGQLPFTDKEGIEFQIVSMVQYAIAYNTDLVKKGDLTNYKDLLKPQYRGKIVAHDPSIPGASNAFFTNLYDLVGEKEAIDFLNKLVKDQGASVTRQYRENVENLAKGKYAVLLGPATDLIAQFMKVGAPVDFAITSERAYTIASSGSLALPSRSPHPNATTVFVNWLLTKEGQSIFATNMANPSTRLDASTEGINPLIVPDPKAKYYNTVSEDGYAHRDVITPLLTKAMRDLSK
ncbi:MAG: extracellular solute-binding protein [Chloroflexi bacterium]|nr:extracellular solute-binding protein [Chloroflexota bacterium]